MVSAHVLCRRTLRAVHDDLDVARADGGQGTDVRQEVRRLGVVVGDDK